MQATSFGSVLGVTDFGSVEGSPLVPPSYLTVYFILFLALLCVSYIYFYRKKKPVLLWHKLRLLASIAIVLKITAVLGTMLVFAYWLIPTPGIRRTIPQANSPSFSTTNRVEIVFDRPVSRKELQKSISPEVPGRWVFENSIYTTHLYRKLVFYPTFSFRPNTTYAIKLSGISNFVKISEAYDYQFKFTTQASPKIISVKPVSGQSGVDITSEIKVTLDKPNSRVSEFEFVFDPPLDYDSKLNSTNLVYTLKPKTPLKQGTKYNLKIQKSDTILNLEDASVIERGITTEEYDGTFTTLLAPGILSFQPQASNALIDSEIIINFSQKMDRMSVEKNFSVDPAVSGQFKWVDDANLTFKPYKLNFGTEYKVKIAKGTQSQDGGFLETDLINTFKTIGSVKVSQFSPQDKWTGVNIRSPIKVTFDQEVDRSSAENLFSVTPKFNGKFTWEDNILSYTPIDPLSYTTDYIVAVEKGVKSIHGTSSQEKFQIQFTTQNASQKLEVPAYLQKYTLSCEIASLRMALNFKGANVSEDDLIPIVGTDTTPHSGNIWGNPYNAFVGNIRGTQMVDGYGVYWGPIAKAALSYRNSKQFQNWNIKDLTREISKGNPVIIWVYSHFGTKTSWNTPDGTQIYAVRDEHAVVAVGFVGTMDNPTQIIINDPLSGQVYWSRSSFDNKWNIFGNSGVVIY